MKAESTEQETSPVGGGFTPTSELRTTDQTGDHSRVVHGLAMLLTIAVFPLIWVGGLVTTYGAGMAVPDWPGTYGWNMFAYPLSTWLYGPFDLMAEHSHRLLGSLAGFISIGLVVAAFRLDSRRWFRWWSVIVLAAVIAQGVLGGVRVLLDERIIAMTHGCVGPLFFAIATATAVMSSRWWRTSQADRPVSSRWLTWSGSLLLLVSYCQLIVGAQLRHVTGATPPAMFTGFVHLHLTLASLVLLLTLMLAGYVAVTRGEPRRVAFPVFWLLLAVTLQIGLGVGTWMVRYALPWRDLDQRLAEWIIQASGYWESVVITAHVATGSLIISLATVISLRAWRSRAVGSTHGP